MSERELTRDEIAAMWVYGREYSQQKRGIIEWWANQGQSKHDVIAELLARLDSATPASAPVGERTELRRVVLNFLGHNEGLDCMDADAIAEWCKDFRAALDHDAARG